MALRLANIRLQVQVFNEDGVPGEIKEIKLTFLPKWYQTWLFKTGVILLFIGGAYSLYRYRISQIRKREQMRKQISTDLHDDIGSTLNSLKIFSNLALLHPGKQDYLNQIKEGVQSATISARDMMWVLDDKLDTVSDLINRFEQFARPLAGANHIKLEKQIDDELVFHLLKKEEKRNLYLIFNRSI